MSQTTLEPVTSTDRNNLVANGDFSRGEIGGLPDGWTVATKNDLLGPGFQLVEADGVRALQAGGNGRDDCFGWIKTVVKLAGNSHYRFRVRLRLDGLENPNRHVIHNLYGLDHSDGGFNHGIFAYQRQSDGSILGEGVFPGPKKDREAEVRLYFRYAATGSVRWEHVSVEQIEAPPPRLVKIAVVKGTFGLDYWQEVLDEAGRAKCDIVLLPEVFDGNYDAGKGTSMDSPAVRLLADNARKHRMYVAATLYVKDGDCSHNRAPLFDRDGNLMGFHDKVVLYDPEVESGASGGRDYHIFPCDFGRVGIMTCYESWYPGVAQLLALKGAELILFPSAGYYEELIHARAADNGVVIAASSLGCAADVWDSGGNRAGGEAHPDPSRNAPTSIVGVEKVPKYQLMMATVDLNLQPSPHSWGGPMYSAPGGRRVRNTSLISLEDEIAREVRRW